MTVTKESILKASPAAAPYVDELLRQMADVGILQSPLRSAHFLGQIVVESGNFKNVVENLNYSAEALKKMFGRHRISIEQCDQYGRTKAHKADQEALANILYGGAFGAKQLGNTQPGDGWAFRGRGLKQLTGRDNYTRFSKHWLGTDELLRKPERVAEPDGAVASAIWFWVANKLSEIADTGSVAAVTKKVNGGSIGLAERTSNTNLFLRAFA